MASKKVNLLSQYIPEQTPEEMMGFPEPDFTGEEMSVNGESPREMTIPSEPMKFNMMPPIDPNNGVPTSLVNAGKSNQEKLLEMINSPEYKAKLQELSDRSRQSLDEQRQGIQSNENDINNIASQKPRVDLTSLLGWFDSLSGGRGQAAKNYQRPTSAEDKAMKVLALKNQLQIQKKGLSSEELAFLKSQISGEMSPLSQLNSMAKIDAYGGKTQDALLQRQVARQDFQEHQNVLKSIDQDKTNIQRLSNYSNLTNALTNFTNASIRSPNQLAELEQTIRGSLGVKGVGGVEERDQTYLKTFERELIKAKQYWSSNPTDVQGIQTTINHLKELAQNEQGNFRNQVQTRYKALVGGHETLYERNPHLQQDLQNKIQAASAQFTPPTIIEKPRDKQGHVIKKRGMAPQAPAKISGPGLDADLESMSPEELQQWMQTHGQ